MKDGRTDEHYGIERTAAFDLGWDGNSGKGTVTLQRAGQGAQNEHEPKHHHRHSRKEGKQVQNPS
jgi:hypothetical protein